MVIPKGKLNIFNVISVINLIGLTAVVLIIAVVSYNVLFTDIFGSETGRVLRNRFLEPFLKKVDVSYMFFNINSSGLPAYDIVISPKKYNKLLSARENKLNDPYYEFPYVKAEFIHEGRRYGVKVKLRGLLSNHWMEEKKSWRVKFSGDNLFYGKKRINLIIPADRDYIKEHLAYYTARKFGLIAPESKFVTLSINGRSQGVYFQVEQMGKEFLTHNFRPENTDLYDGEDNDLRANIFRDMAYWTKIRSESVSGFENYSNVYELLDLLNRSDDDDFYRKLPELVDVEKMLRWNANSMLYFDYHQNNVHNVRLLFSPVTGRFEPLIWDCSHPVFTEGIDRLYNDLITRMLKNPAYLNRRNQILWDYVSDPENLKEDMAFFDSTYKSIRTAFLADRKKNISNLRFIYVMRNIRGDIEQYYGSIKDRLEKSRAHAVVHYNVGQPEVFARLEISSGDFSAARLDGVRIGGEGEAGAYQLYYDSDKDGVFQDTDALLGESSVSGEGGPVIDDIGFVLFSGRTVEGDMLVPSDEKYDFFLVSRNGGADGGYREIKIKTTNAVTGRDVEPVVKAVNDADFRYFDLITSSPEEFAERYAFVTGPRENGKFTVGPGEYRIDETVIVPDGVTVKISPGTVFRFGPGVSFISYGRILARGTRDLPVVFGAVDGKEPWGVFAVVNEGADGSVFSNVHVSSGSEAFMNGIYFSGALAAHGADVLVEDCVFERNTGDDALNIKNDTGTVERSTFRDNGFDAIDFDFVREGMIANCLFESNGNDSIDLGSSSPVVMGNTIDGSGDKGISCGEKSAPVIFNNRISGCDIGIAAKDDSNVTVINCDITGNGKGISSYIKKPLWQRSGTIHVYNSILDNDADLVLDDSGRVTVKHSFVSDGKYRDEKNSVWTGKGWEPERIKGLPPDTGIVKEYFPGTDKEKLRLGTF